MSRSGNLLIIITILTRSLFPSVETSPIASKENLTSFRPHDMVLVNAGEVHRPIIHSSRPYERIIIYISPDFLRSYRQADYDLGLCFEKAKQERSNVLRMPSMKNSKLYQVCRELEASFSDTDYASGLYQNLLFLEFMIQLKPRHSP